MKLKLSRPTKLGFPSFNLTPGGEGSCPGETPTCARDCYAKKGRFLFKATKSLNAGNLELTRKSGIKSISDQLLDLIPAGQKFFRLHSAGDFYSQKYIRTWVRVIKARPNTKFFAYTRSFHLNFSSLIELHNFTLWASTDDDNREKAIGFVGENNKVKHAYGPLRADDELPENSFICPVTNGKMEVTGACAKCQLCITSDRTHKHVVFNYP